MNIANVLELPVLVLNKNWQPYDEKNVQRAFEDLTSGYDVAPFRGMDIELEPDGSLLYANPVDFDDWMKLPIRPQDESVRTGKQYVRIPRVIISTNYALISVRPVKLSKVAIKKRDKQQCQYCKKFFDMDELNVDHVVPQFHGGVDSWTNLVCSCIPCNSKKGHKQNHEIGYVPLNEPTEPMAKPVTFMYACKHPSWAPFLPIQK